MIRLITGISEWAYRNASPKNVLACFALLMVFSLVVLPNYTRQISPPGAPGILDTRFGYTPDEAYSTLEAFGEQGRKAYLHMLLIADSLYPFIYGMLLILGASFFLNKGLHKENIFRLLNVIAIDAVIFDFLENFSILYLLYQFPARADGIARLASISGIIKWIMVGLSLCVILAGIAGWIARKHSGRRNVNEC